MDKTTVIRRGEPFCSPVNCTTLKGGKHKVRPYMKKLGRGLPLEIASLVKRLQIR